MRTTLQNPGRFIPRYARLVPETAPSWSSP